MPWDFQKSVPGSLGLPSFKDIWPFIKKNLERICMLFSLKMVVLLHKWEVKNMGVKCLEVRETVWLPGLLDTCIRIRKSWDFLNSTVSASTEALSKIVAGSVIIFKKYISKKIRLGILCESSGQTLFSLKNTHTQKKQQQKKNKKQESVVCCNCD